MSGRTRQVAVSNRDQYATALRKMKPEDDTIGILYERTKKADVAFKARKLIANKTHGIFWQFHILYQRGAVIQRASQEQLEPS